MTDVRDLRTRIGLFVATCGYLGFAPVAPGTFGSAAGLAAYYLLDLTGSAAIYGLATAGLFALGIWSGTAAERALGTTDPGPVVLDEVVGMLITLAFLDVSPAGALAGFLIFRVLDVIKPWPSRRFEDLHGGLGVMADDGMAAIYAHLLMRGLLWLGPAWFAA